MPALVQCFDGTRTHPYTHTHFVHMAVLLLYDGWVRNKYKYQEFAQNAHGSFLFVCLAFVHASLLIQERKSLVTKLFCTLAALQPL